MTSDVLDDVIRRFRDASASVVFCAMAVQHKDDDLSVQLNYN